jgi:hypothetical protein
MMFAFAEKATKLLDIPFSKFCDAKTYPDVVRSTFVTNFLLPMLDGARNCRYQKNIIRPYSHTIFLHTMLRLKDIAIKR